MQGGVASSDPGITYRTWDLTHAQNLEIFLQPMWANINHFWYFYAYEVQITYFFKI